MTNGNIIKEFFSDPNSLKLVGDNDFEGLFIKFNLWLVEHGKYGNTFNSSTLARWLDEADIDATQYLKTLPYSYFKDYIFPKGYYKVPSNITDIEYNTFNKSNLKYLDLSNLRGKFYLKGLNGVKVKSLIIPKEGFNYTGPDEDLRFLEEIIYEGTIDDALNHDISFLDNKEEAEEVFISGVIPLKCKDGTIYTSISDIYSWRS